MAQLTHETLTEAEARTADGTGGRDCRDSLALMANMTRDDGGDDLTVLTADVTRDGGVGGSMTMTHATADG